MDRAPASVPPSPSASTSAPSPATNEQNSTSTPSSRPLDQLSNLPATSSSLTSVTSAYHPPPSPSIGAGLDEFRSLLEAAQRIADSVSEHQHETWTDERFQDPVIRRSANADELRRRIPLTRQYSGRPHVPGEDSGSEAGDALQDHAHMNMEAPRDDGRRSPRPRRLTIVDTSDRRLDEPDQDRERDRQVHESTQAHARAASRASAQSEVSLVRQRRREEILARARERLAATERDGPRVSRDLDGGEGAPAPRMLARQPLSDWILGPDNMNPSERGPEARPRSNSVRRWRPSERLQDYASSSARQDGLGDAADRAQPSPDLTMRTRSAARADASSRATGETADHHDIVDRVERALQEYRIARRALRAQQEEAARGSDSASAIPETLTAPSFSHRPAHGSPTARDALAARHLRDNLDHMHDLVTDGRLSSSRTDEGPPSFFVRAERTRRDDSLRQRLREQARERRHRLVSTMLEHDNALSYGSGPLFEGATDHDERDGGEDSERWVIDTRSMFEKVRRAEVRARSPELKQAKAALQYLARLRTPDMTAVQAWTVAADLGLHNQSLTEEAKTFLPMSVDDLPQPAFCSWLMPGTTWAGTQSADEAEGNKTARVRAVTEALRRAREQRDRVDVAPRPDEPARARPRLEQARDPRARVLTPTRNPTMSPDDFLSVARNSMQVLEEAERDLSTMLQRSERLLQENERQLQENEAQLRRNRERLREHDERLARLREATTDAYGNPPRAGTQSRTRDRWNVKVTLHEVSWSKMTVTGTMTASSAADLHVGADTDHLNTPPTSMDSFFTGEIIDFSTHGLDTVASVDKTGDRATRAASRQQDWKIGGPSIDLTYWAGIGPFKEAIDRAMQSREGEIQQAIRRQELDNLPPHTPPPVVQVGSDQDSSCPTPDFDKPDAQLPTDPPPGTLTDDERADLKLKTMHDLLTNAHWLDENINKKGWFLMRWKERCFVSPGAGPNPEPTRPWIPNHPHEHSTVSHTLPDSALARGWYSFTDLYGRRPDRNRIFTTNAAEREEIFGGTNPAESSAAGARQTQADREGPQPTWGLTISGFYYVALHRQTGRIEGLYYDNGSAPFQTLRMTPQTFGYGGASGEPVNVEMQLDANEGEEQTMMVDNRCDMAGLRTNFNLVQFR